MKAFLKNEYGLNAVAITPMTSGAGGNTYRVEVNSKNYVLKLTKEDSMNHPLVELFVCEALRNNGINTLTFIKNRDNAFSSEFNGFIVNVYEYIDGMTYQHDE